jgi:L-lactate dehydrogenase complex protein LldG
MTMSSRDNILARLRVAHSPFEDIPPVTERRHMAPVNDTSPAALQSRFVREAEALGCSVTCVSDPDQAVEHVLGLINPDKIIQSWDFAHIPLPKLPDALTKAEIRVVPGNTTARTGLTGADAALAGTGSLVLVTGPGKPRRPSLMPPVHISVITADQIVPNLDTWAASHHADDFQRVRSANNIVVISGPSRTGDIANIPVKGVHGPGAVHIILIAKQR